MNIGELLFQCDVESRELFRKFERINKKIIDSKWSKNFNEICLKENLKYQVSSIKCLKKFNKFCWYSQKAWKL